MKEKALVLFSGGVDSTTCLAMAMAEFGKENVMALSIIYGQKHGKELECSKKILQYYGVKGFEIDVTPLFVDSSCSLLSQSEREIPVGTYEEQKEKDGNAAISTYVPFRNGVFLSMATAIAYSHECKYVYYGAHGDDATENAYPDCSTAFHDAMGRAVAEGTAGFTVLRAPFIHRRKSDVIREGIALGVPFHLTWSCYEGKEVPCGKCATCLDRKRAFAENGMTDPLFT